MRYLLFAARVRDGLGEHRREQVEAHGAHVAALLGAQDAARTANLEVLHRHLHAASQVGELADGLQTLGRLLGERLFGGKRKYA